MAQADRVDFLSYKPQIISHARPVNCPLFVSHRHLALSSLVLGCHICSRCSRSSAPSSRLTGSSPPDPANRPCELFASALHRRSLPCLLEYTPDLLRKAVPSSLGAPDEPAVLPTLFLSPSRRHSSLPQFSTRPSLTLSDCCASASARRVASACGCNRPPARPPSS